MAVRTIKIAAFALDLAGCTTVAVGVVNDGLRVEGPV